MRLIQQYTLDKKRQHKVQKIEANLFRKSSCLVLYLTLFKENKCCFILPLVPIIMISFGTPQESLPCTKLTEQHLMT